MSKYSVVYADPPWNQKAGPNLSGGYKVVDGKQVFNAKSNRSENLPYKTMSVQEIAALGVKNIVEKDAHLYLWVTNKYLLEAAAVIEAWGFKYSTSIIWQKNIMGGGLGGAYRISHEQLLFCTRGNLKATDRVLGTVFNEKRPYVNGFPCHSKKPDKFAEMIERVSPGTRIELFARSKRFGWSVWGNEVESDIIL